MKKRKLQIFIIILIIAMMTLGLLMANIASASERNTNDFKSKLDNTVPKLMKRYNIPGAAIGIVQNGEVVCTLNYGVADKKQNKPVTSDTIFQVGSISKSLAAWGVMHLVDEGRINLDDPAEKYLTRWHIPNSKFDKNQVTIRRLLSHTAGLSVHGYMGTDPGKKVPTVEQSLSSNGVKIIIQPGSEFMYSGGGYTVLQLIVEEVTKEPFDKYMYDEILKPLGMIHSSYSDNIKDSDMSNAYGVLGQKLPNYNFAEKAAAGLKTTIPDFTKFIIASMDGNNGEVRGRGILKSQTLDSMFTEVKSSYGLGVCTYKLSDGTTLISHGGANVGWRAQYGFIPDKKDGFVIFTNSDTGLDLTDDVMNFWVQYETGTMPKQYYSEEKTRNIISAAAVIMAVMLAVYLAFFIIKFKKGKSIFIAKAKNKSTFRTIMRLGLPLLIGSVWCYLYYNLDIASVIPYAFHWVSYAIIMWTAVLFITGLFTKAKENN